MGGESFGFSHGFHHRTEGLQAGDRKSLKSDFLHERVKRHAAVLPGVAAGGQRVISAGGIVAHRLGREMPQEHRARIRNLRGQGFSLVGGQNKVLGGVLVGEGHHRGRIGQKDGDAVLQCLGRYLTTGKRCELALDFGLHLRKYAGRITQYHHLRIGTVLGLRQQIGGHKGRVRTGIGDDQHFRRPGRHVDGYPVFGSGQLLGRCDVAVAGAEDFIHRWHASSAQGQGGHSLRATGFHHHADAQ